MIAFSLLISSSILFASQRVQYNPTIKNENVIFVLPCEKEIRLNDLAMTEFYDDWGKSDSAIRIFKKNLLSSLERSIHKEFPSVHFANADMFCSESNGKLRSEIIQDESIIDENLVDERYVAITRKLPESIDTSKAVYVIIQKVEYYVDVVKHKGQQVMGIYNGTPRYSYTKDSNSNRMALKYEFIIVNPMQERYVFANRYSAISSWAMGAKNWITQWNWNRIESKLIDNVIEQTRKNIAFKSAYRTDAAE